MADTTYLPIKVVLRQDSDERPLKPKKMDDPEVLGPVTQELRDEFAKKVTDIERQFQGSFKKFPDVPAVAKVVLKAEAIAKYRRPSFFFNSDTCPIIGGGNTRELYAGALPTGLAELARRLKRGVHKHAEAQISTLVSIEPFTEADALGGTSLGDLQELCADKKKPLKLRLFNHKSRKANLAVENALKAILLEIGGVQAKLVPYAPNLLIYSILGLPASGVAKVAAFTGTQRLSVFPTYRIVRPASRALKNVTATGFPPPDPNRDYGVVGIIDSGTDPNNPHLKAWVVDRKEHVPPDQQDNDHGSFVAGLIANPRLLNNGNPEFPSVSSKVVDIVAIDKSKGIDEFDLKTIVEDSVRRYPHVKIWNMSLTVDQNTCKDDEFSEFAAFLDNISTQHKVLFHLPAGNYLDGQMRSWPPQGGIGDDDRVQPPADSVASIVVGSIAHLDSANTRVRAGEPSPFSRRGPGGAYHLKPELTAFAGNCDGNGNYVQVGVLSLDGSGNIAESIGTSFASPQVSSVSAHIHRELTVGSETPSPGLVKALQLHGAFIKAGCPDRSLMQYVGLGRPAEPDVVLNCTKSSITCIFQISVTSSPLFVRRPFPIPTCLVENGSLKAEMFMTLYYVPPTDRTYDAEYCRTNVYASLGTVRKTKDKKVGATIEKHFKEIHGVPDDLDDGWEADLIKSGFKWSPLKLYYRRFEKKPMKNDDWQLQLVFQSRPEYVSSRKQDVNLIVTLRDPSGKQENVYTEMVRLMQKHGWKTEDLRLRSRARVAHKP